MNHRRRHETEGVRAGDQRVAVLYNLLFLTAKFRKELSDKAERLRAADKDDIRVSGYECLQQSAVVRLHMQNNEIRRTGACKSRFQIFQILSRDRNVCRVENNGLFILYNITVIGNALRKREQVLKP